MLNVMLALNTWSSRALQSSSDTCSSYLRGVQFAENNYPTVLLYAAFSAKIAREILFEENLWRFMCSRTAGLHAPHEMC